VTRDELLIEVLRLRNVECLTVRETAARLDVSKSYVSKLELEHKHGRPTGPARVIDRDEVEELALAVRSSPTLLLELLPLHVLDADERQALIDTELVGCSLRETAERMGCSHNHVLVLKRRAIRRLGSTFAGGLEVAA
jgi:DNA-directed RNA polymerase specialized sigma24 family protein